MVRIRLTRLGTHKRPFYRVIVADSRKARDGANIELIGHYDPLPENKAIKIDLDRVDYWLSVGARPSETVERLIKKAREAAAAGQA